MSDPIKPRGPLALRLALVAGLLAAIAPPAAAQRRPPQVDPPTDLKAEPQNKRMERKPKSPAASPALIAAARTKPVAPEVIARRIPEKIGRFTRGPVEPLVHQIGPAMYSEVRCPLAGSDKQGTALLTIIDYAGLEDDRHPMPPVGKALDGRKGMEVSGFRAVLQDGDGGSRLEVRLSPRMILILEGERVKGGELVAIAEDVDLAGLAKLTM